MKWSMPHLTLTWCFLRLDVLPWPALHFALQIFVFEVLKSVATFANALARHCPVCVGLVSVFLSNIYASLLSNPDALSKYQNLAPIDST